jgi:hypothetical protein
LACGCGLGADTGGGAFTCGVGAGGSFGVAICWGGPFTCGVGPGIDAGAGFGVAKFVGFEVGVAAGLVSGMADAFGALRFGGVDFVTLGDPPGTGPVSDGFSPDADCLGPGVLGCVGLPPGNPGGTVAGADGF